MAVVESGGEVVPGRPITVTLPDTPRVPSPPSRQSVIGRSAHHQRHETDVDWSSYGLDDALRRLTLHQAIHAITSPNQTSNSADPIPPSKPATMSRATSAKNPLARGATVTLATLPTRTPLRVRFQKERTTGDRPERA